MALREGDLGYLHVHPETEPADGQIKFWLTAPGPGRYRLYLDFQVAGEVRTAEFTLTSPDPPASPRSPIMKRLPPPRRSAQ